MSWRAVPVNATQDIIGFMAEAEQFVGASGTNSGRMEDWEGHLQRISEKNAVAGPVFSAKG